MRYFISIDVEDEDVRENLVNFIDEIKDLGDLNPVDPGNLHLTLLFLGERGEAELGDIKTRFTEAMKDVSVGEFECSLSHLGVFPHMNYIKTVWVGTEPEDKLRDIHMKLDEKMKGKNEHDFVPHVTVARVKNVSGREKEELRENIERYPADFGGFKVEHVRLKQSELTPDGPVYEDVKVVDL